MRYVAALCYALAIAAHSGALLNTLVLGGLVFVGTVAVLFALEGIIKDALRPPPATGSEVAELFARKADDVEARRKGMHHAGFR